MRASSLAFSQGLEALRQYLLALDLEAELLSKRVTSATPSDVEKYFQHLKDHLSRSITTKRQFDYNSAIISLYGYFEQFIEGMLRDYATALNNIMPSYSLLPEALLKRHLELSFRLISRIEQTGYKTTITTPEIIANLQSCMTNSTSYKINAEAFSYHSSNFRIDSLNTSFSGVGLVGISQKVIEHHVFAAYLQNQDPPIDPKTVEPEQAFAFIEDLAERRNEVSHGLPSAILANSILYDYIDFFQAYGGALFEVIYNATLPFVAQHQAINIGAPLAVYNHSIVCVCLQNIGVKEGDVLIAKLADDTYRSGDIEEIQVNNVPYPEVQPEPSIDVGLKVSFHAKDTQTFLLLPRALKI